ncbi:fumarylpyruvate hydrolase [Ancylobacter aquaticus]|uniref:Fumarylpyruvate hydrolase n=1 Tax=Ancylobacter aquaticus TaxID=100 RepID=A0A4R1I9C4_ANCAQ|nr:fumarylacetoacetate hydrolase family protein [Ancylobacter aquaticus]TCK30841.1 fumarylpyruvate hydrolase [Ancylobacter aquaticus]
MARPTVPPVTLPVLGEDEPFPVRRVYLVGRNYVDHIREMKEGDERDPPFFFQKPTDSVMPPDSVVDYPPETSDFQFEVELVAVIGSEARNVTPEQAPDYVFGYAVGLDLTRRDRQREACKRGVAWEVGKSFDQSAPCGLIAPVSAVGHIVSGEIKIDVNGERRQTGDILHMIWKVPEIIANLSRSYVLKPGDLIYTGTPAGVGAVVPGDRLDASVAGLPPLTITIGEPRHQAA